MKTKRVSRFIVKCILKTFKKRYLEFVGTKADLQLSILKITKRK